MMNQRACPKQRRKPRSRSVSIPRLFILSIPTLHSSACRSSFLSFFQGSLRPPSKVGRSRAKPSIPPVQPTAPIRPVERDRTATSILPNVPHRRRVEPETSATDQDEQDDPTESEDEGLIFMLAGRRITPPARLTPTPTPTPAPVSPHSPGPTPSRSVDVDTAPLARRTFLAFPLPFPFTPFSHPSSPSQPPAAKHTSTVRHPPILTIPKFMSLDPKDVHAFAEGDHTADQESAATSPHIAPSSQQERRRPITPSSSATDPARTSSPPFILSFFLLISMYSKASPGVFPSQYVHLLRLSLFRLPNLSHPSYSHFR